MKNKFNFLSIILIEIYLIVKTTSLPVVDRFTSFLSNTTLSTESTQKSSSLSSSAITSIIIISSLSLVLFCFFIIVFLHYRLIRKLPDDEMGSSLGTINVSDKKSSPTKVHFEQDLPSRTVSTIETIDTKRVQFDIAQRFTLRNQYNLISMKSLSNSTESVYTPIDNLSEFEENTSDSEFLLDDCSSISDDEETRNLMRKKSDSCENFVVKLQQFDVNLNRKKDLEFNKSVILNVMNINYDQKLTSYEKTYL
ncbi:unnamed protein product [Brachionus calyciflorus]|uniref:Uncharacterized protein n=1 Tax=Brachionus calyciflorus TaxID=104777 RepID=A0A813MXF3_9BILA|nr:unnamed protein product [Brachionus calyciflorus]